MKSSGQVRLPSVDVDAFSVFDARNETGTPERNLLMAILERAILDYLGNQNSEAMSAEEWIFGEHSSRFMESFSFPWVCQQLDLDIKKVTAVINSMPKRGENRTAPWYWKDYINSRN